MVGGAYSHLDEMFASQYQSIDLSEVEDVPYATLKTQLMMILFVLFNRPSTPALTV